MKAVDPVAQPKKIKTEIPNAGVGQEKAGTGPKTRKTDTEADLEIERIGIEADQKIGTKDAEVDQVTEQRDERAGRQSSEIENERYPRN